MAEKKLLKLENPEFKGPSKMDVMESGESQSPFGYSGPGIYPTPEGDTLIGKMAEARLKGIYEAYGRGPNAVARMKLDPAYASARAAGIQLPGDGMRGTSKTASLADGQSEELIGGGQRSTRYRDAGAGMRASGEAKTVAESAYGSGSEQKTEGKNIGTQEVPAANPSESLPKPINDPTSPAAPTSPGNGKPPTVESTKGPRIAVQTLPKRFDGYKTEARDTEIAQRTGEVQDRSRYGGDRVVSRQAYTSKGGKEMIGNQMQRPDGSTYFAGLPSADQNKADAFNRNVGSNFNQYNNFSASPQNYKASAEDMRANYAFGGGSGPGGTLVSENKDGMTGRNRQQLDADTGKFSAGSNYSGDQSRGMQTTQSGQTNFTMNDLLPSGQGQPIFMGPQGDEMKKKQKEIARSNSKTLPI